jgi:acetylornithine aminotransferase
MKRKVDNSYGIIPFYIPFEKIVEKLKGCYLYDSEGKQYTDFESGVWCANLGHSNDRIVKAMEAGIRQSIHHGYKFRNHPSEFLSRELVRITGLEKGSSVFLSSGSEAVNLAISMARNLTGREKILKIHNSYLSAYGYGQITPGNNHIVNVRFNDMQSLDETNFGEIAALVLETGGASIDMVRFPDYAFIKELVELSTANGCLVVADEVTTGMGRMGKWFGFQCYGFLPDIVVTGKALGNGYPVSAVTVSAKISESFGSNSFRHLQSHQNDPMGCVIGLEVIKTIEDENLLNRCLDTGYYFKEQLLFLNARFKQEIREVRGRGLMIALELDNPVNGELVSDLLFERGFVIGYKANTLRFLPPLVIEITEIDRLITNIGEILELLRQ